MKSVLSILLALCGIVLAGNLQVVAQIPPPAAIPPTSLPQPQIPPAQVPETWLMLKNGSTFAARMLSAGERVKLRVNDGDLEIRASEIALTGYSLGDLAEQQWALLHQQQLDKQFSFIDWCTRHQLYDHADAALAQMALGGQETQRIAGYQVRLKRLREIQQEQLAAVAATRAMPTTSSYGNAPLIANQQAAKEPAVVNKPLPALQQAAYQPLDNPRDSSSSAKEPPLVSPNPGTLSPPAVELFAARVQPWVVSRCSNAGCHDSHSTNNFKLERYSKQEAIPRATTLKNMAATTRLVDLHKPLESPLLVMSARAHGTTLVPPIAAGDGAALAAFREFVALATGRELPKETKPEKTTVDSLRDPSVHITPGRATFPASAADESAPEDKAAALLKQTGPGWQAAIERQRAIDLEAQRLKELEQNSQRANETRGLIVDPAVQPAAAAASPTVLSPTMIQPVPASAPPQPPALLLPPPALSALPESLLPKSLAPPPRNNLEMPSAPTETPALGAELRPSRALGSTSSLPELPSSPAAPLAPTTAAAAKVPPKIDLKKQRRMFPLPPDEAPPPPAVGTGETIRR